MTNDDYHKLGFNEDPRQIVLSSSPLYMHFLEIGRFKASSPRAFYQRFVENPEPAPKTAAMWGGTFLHLMLLEGWEVWEPPVIDTDTRVKGPPALIKATMGEGRILAPPGWLIDGIVKFRGALFIPSPLPSKPAPSSTKGKEWFENLKHDVEWRSDLGLELVYTRTPKGYPTTTEINTELDAALAVTEWLKDTDVKTVEDGVVVRSFSAQPVSAQQARYLLMEAPGKVEQVHEAKWNDVKVHAKVDRILDEDGCIVDLKRTRNAHPKVFETSLYRARLYFYEYCIECDYCEGTGLSDQDRETQEDCIWCDGRGHGRKRPWRVVAINPEGPETYVHEISDRQRDLAQIEVENAMGIFERCVETGQWVRPAENVSEHTTADPKHWEYPVEEDPEEPYDEDVPW